MKKINLLLILTLVLAIFLRLYQLGKTPVSLEWDEVALGYDAYSILKTGRDQFGKFLPLTFRSLDDYKPPIYEYLAVPSVALFGLTEFATRLPSAFFGILTVLLTFILGRIIFSEDKSINKNSVYIGLIASILLAISPWHLQFSRAAFEVNISVFFTVSAILLFLLGLNKPGLFYLSSIFFGLDLFSYHSARVISPILLIFLFLLLNKRLPGKRIIGVFFSIYIIFIILVFPILISPDSQTRFKATNIFNPGARYLNEKDLPAQFLESRLNDEKAGFTLAGKIFHNSRFIYLDYETLKKAFYKYLSNYNFEYLFIKGDAPLHHAPDFGLLYLIEFPFLIGGMIYIIFKGLNRYSLFVILWLLISPIVNAVTREAPHAVRTELILPTYQLITALGIWKFFTIVRRESRWVFLSLLTLFIFLFGINQASYFHQYYVHTDYELSKNWMYGRKEAVEYTESAKNQYDKVYVSQNVDQPYIFWLFYTKYSPQLYLNEGGTASGGFAEYRNQFDQYEFHNFNYSQLDNARKLLLVGLPSDFPPDAKVLRTIYYLDGTKALVIAQN